MGIISDNYEQMAETDAGTETDRIGQNAEKVQQQNRQKSENLVGGIVGALFGSLIGILCNVFSYELMFCFMPIILLYGLFLDNQLVDWLTGLSGIVMAVCTIKGYEILGRKLTKRGVIISIIIIVIMTYVGQTLNWSRAAAIADNTKLADGFRTMLLAFRDGIVADSYWEGLGRLYLFAALGAFLTIRSSLKKHKRKNEFGQSGTTNMH